MSSVVSAETTKLRELVLYVAERIQADPTGGATKINKILFFSEFAHVRVTGRPITGAAYQKLPHGPAPRRLVPIRKALLDDGDAVLTEDNYFGYSQKRLVPRRPADTTVFSGDELKVVDQVIEALWGKSAVEVSEMSHREMAWRMVDEKEEIPFSAAFLSPEVVVTDAMRDHAEELSRRLC